MATAGIVYNGHLIWRDAFRWIVRGNGMLNRFKTLHAAKAFIDRIESEGGTKGESL